jgi:hypothetical protein
MKFKLKKRVYLALTSLVYLILNEYNVIDIAQGNWDMYVGVLASVLSGVGILSAPQKEVNVETNIDENIGA